MMRSGRMGWHGSRHVLRDVVFGKQSLSLQIAGFDKIAVNDSQMSDSRASQRIRDNTSQRTAADQQNARTGKAFLPVFTDTVEQHLLLIA